MRRFEKGCLGAFLGIALLLSQGVSGWTALAEPPSTPKVFFSQGQAAYSPQELSKSQREALLDLQLQAIVQAASAFLSPAQLGKDFPLIQEKILKQPQRYVQTYQVFSEGPSSGGLYRMTGQVIVSMDLLKKDLLALSATPSGSEPVRIPAQSARGEGASASEPGVKVRSPEEAAEKAAARGVGVLWVVAEKWDRGWHLPGDGRDPEGPFAASVFQEAPDHSWNLHFPEQGALSPDDEGEVSESHALAQAAALGTASVVVGRVALAENQDGEARMGAVLRLYNTASGKAQGEIHKELALGDLSSHEAAIELAALVIPQLDRQFRGSSESVSGAGVFEETGQAAKPTARSVEAAEASAKPGEAGELVVQIKSSDAYADWLVVEKMLREHFPNLQVKGIEIGTAGSLVRLQGVDGDGIKKLEGTRLPNGALVQVSEFGAEGQGVKITLTGSESSRGEPKP